MLPYSQAAYYDPGQQGPTGFMASGGEFHKSGNASHWADQKQPSFPSPTLSDNAKWETVAICMSVA